MPADDVDPDAPAHARIRAWQRLRPFVKPLLIVVVSLAVGWIIVGLVGRVDWAQVGSALGRLQWWHALPLALGLLVRQSFNAVPLTQFVPGLPFGRSLQNDVTANLIGTIAPPPGDVVLRVAMFKSWGIDPVDGMAGVTLNMLTFYVVRFIAPAFGLLVLAVQGVERGQVIPALLSALVAVAMLAALVLISRGDAFASWVGRASGRVVRRFRASVEPERWADVVVEFRGRMSHTLVKGLPKAMGALVLMVLSDGCIVLLSLRLVGVGSEQLTVADVIGAFLLAYPLTLLPLVGIGVLDAALVAAYTEIAGIAWESEILAGLVVWRVVTVLGPLGLGAISLLWWRSHAGRDAGEIL